MRWLPLLVASACTLPPTLPILTWDADAGCFVEDPEGFARADLPEGDCAEDPTPAVAPDASCVVIPSTCLPRGYGPAGANPACAEAVAAWQDDAPLCGEAPDDSGA